MEDALSALHLSDAINPSGIFEARLTLMDSVVNGKINIAEADTSLTGFNDTIGLRIRLPLTLLSLPAYSLWYIMR